MEIYENYYLPVHTLKDSRIRANAWLVYSMIYTTCMNSNENIFTGSNKEIAQFFNATPTAVSLWIKELKDFGYINCYTEYIDGSNQIQRRVITVNDNHYPFKKYVPKNTSVSAYLYMLKDENDLYKIGIAKDPRNRAHDFKHRKAKVIFSTLINDAQKTEAKLHKLYKNYRVDKNAEWFSFNDRDINDIINEINTAVCP